ncbi:N-acetylmuramic acid 6-phosphate etherase [Beijerinckiaceae bacterium]|nr:N-acetylmuramic acid 6-phosphate etherase [Beijerinckiaceae bacterium]
MATEHVSSRFIDLDEWTPAEVVEAMWEGHMAAVASVRPAIGAIAAAVEAAVAALGENGRLVYFGAGTSGRIAIQDGAELTPTFGWPRERLVFGMAGGDAALICTAEGAEDDTADAIRLVDCNDIGPSDVVIGVAASGTTSFTVAATQRANKRGAVTIGIANNPGTPLLAAARHPILIATGSELIAGSTRMKAGTAQKVVLNLLSTGIMVRLGRVYRGMMVDMHTSNAKLRRRAELMVTRIAGCDSAIATKALARAGGDIKLAALIVLGLSEEEATALLAKNRGSLRLALAEMTDEGVS